MGRDFVPLLHQIIAGCLNLGTRFRFAFTPNFPYALHPPPTSPHIPPTSSSNLLRRPPHVPHPPTFCHIPPTAIHMLSTCYLHATHMSPTCPRHAVRLPAWHLPKPPPSPQTAAHNPHLRRLPDRSFRPAPWTNDPCSSLSSNPYTGHGLLISRPACRPECRPQMSARI